MQQRIFTLVSAVLSLAASFAAPAPAYAADDCLSGPGAATPAGQHWYYRIDRGTKKHCWYLADQGARTNKAASPAGVASTAEEAQPAPLEETVADARAELPATNSIAAAPVILSPAQPASDVSLSNDNGRDLSARDLITQAPINLASRLPLPDEFQPTEPQQTQIAAAATPAPSEQPKQFNPPQGAEAHIGPMQIILCALAIALALAAILGRAIFRYFAGARRKRVAQLRRRQIWSEDISQGRKQPSYAQMITPERRARVGRVDHDVAEIEQLLRSGPRRLR